MAQRRRKPADDLTPIDSAVADLDATWLLCRDVHHAWEVVGFDTIGGGMVARTASCVRCTTERVDEWTLGGARVRSYYRYPEGYQFRGVDMTDDPRMALRREVMRRAGVRGTGGRRTRRRNQEG